MKLLAHAEKTKGGESSFFKWDFNNEIVQDRYHIQKIYVVGGRKDLMTRPRVLMGKLCKGIDAGIR